MAGSPPPSCVGSTTYITRVFFIQDIFRIKFNLTEMGRKIWQEKLHHPGCCIRFASVSVSNFSTKSTIRRKHRASNQGHELSPHFGSIHKHATTISSFGFQGSKSNTKHPISDRQFIKLEFGVNRNNFVFHILYY